MSFMPEEQFDLFNSNISDKQLMPMGLWIVVEVHAYKPGSIFRMSVIWTRKGRKTHKVMKLKPVVLPVTPHEIQPYIEDDWVYGVKKGESYGILLDIDYHGLRQNNDDFKLSFLVEPIEVLDFLASV